MLCIIRYLVFLFFIFNMGIGYAIPLEIENEESFEEPLSGQDVSRLDLPDPLQLREILVREEINLPSRIWALAQYFNARYPGHAINADFSNDIALLFPELTEQEIYERTSFVRRSVKIYRMGQEYAQKIKEKILAPEPPPLYLEEKDFEEEQFPYIEAPEGKFVLRTDFRKVLTYGQNPRDLRAIEAFAQHRLKRQKNKTNFEKFKSMITKLEFSKLPFYGISEPNPLSGNAGIGKWVENDGIRVRLIADMAKINDETTLLVALHFDIPPYRFIKALGPQKPQIEFDLKPPLQSLKIFYPRPVSVVSDRLMGAYADNFALPVLLELQKPTDLLKLRADVRLVSCDMSFHCQPVELSPTLEIEYADENVTSGMRNFIRQAYLNIPQEENKYIRLNSVTAQLTPDQTKVSRIVFSFDYDARAQNFTLFVEDDKQTEFTPPKVSITENKIYASIEPLNHQNELLGQTFTLTASLNPYTQIRQSFELKTLSQTESLNARSRLSLFFQAFYAGLLFNLSLAGFALWGLTQPVSNKKKYLLGAALGVFLTAQILAFVLFYLSASFNVLAWSAAYRWTPYLVFAFLAAWLLRLQLHTLPPLLAHDEGLKGFLVGILLILLAPVSLSPLLSKTICLAFSQDLGAFLSVSYGFSLGVVLVYGLFLIKISSAKLRELIRLVSLLFLYFLSGHILLLILLQFHFFDICLIFFFSFLGGLILTYAFSFLKALAKTRISKRNKRKTFFAVCALTAVFILGISTLGSLISLPAASSKFPSEKFIQHEIYSGKTVLIAVQADWCFWCFYNNLTVFDQKRLHRWQKEFNLTYYPINATTPNRALISYLQKFKCGGAPLYVLYNYNLNQGYVLPDVLTASGFEQILHRLKI